MTWNYKQWNRDYGRLRNIAERIDRMRGQRANRVWSIALGYNPRQWNWHGCCVHNAAIADIGVGWGAGPNGRTIIKAARRATRIMDSSFDGYRILSRWCDRTHSRYFA